MSVELGKCFWTQCATWWSIYELNLTFLHHIDHSHIYETVEEVPVPFSAERSSGKIPDWLQGMKNDKKKIKF